MNSNLISTARISDGTDQSRVEAIGDAALEAESLWQSKTRESSLAEHQAQMAVGDLREYLRGLEDTPEVLALMRYLKASHDLLVCSHPLVTTQLIDDLSGDIPESAFSAVVLTDKGFGLAFRLCNDISDRDRSLGGVSQYVGFSQTDLGIKHLSNEIDWHSIRVPVGLKISLDSIAPRTLWTERLRPLTDAGVNKEHVQLFLDAAIETLAKSPSMSPAELSEKAFAVVSEKTRLAREARERVECEFQHQIRQQRETEETETRIRQAVNTALLKTTSSVSSIEPGQSYPVTVYWQDVSDDASQVKYREFVECASRIYATLQAAGIESDVVLDDLHQGMLRVIADPKNVRIPRGWCSLSPGLGLEARDPDSISQDLKAGLAEASIKLRCIPRI